MLLTHEKFTVLAKCLDFVTMYLKEFAKILPKQIDINRHTIKIIKSKPPYYTVIYTLYLVDLRLKRSTLKQTLQ